MLARLSIFVCLGLMVGMDLACRDETKTASTLTPTVSQPSPDLSPHDVVQAVMQALQRNDQPNEDAGIAIAYGFASPVTRDSTGTIERFATLVKSPPFSTMLGHKSVDYGPLRVEGDRAEQRLRVTAADGRSIGFSFLLSRQSEGEYSGCWMTDGVLPLRPGGQAPRQMRPAPGPDAEPRQTPRDRLTPVI
jgi:hypothetical protein